MSKASRFKEREYDEVGPTSYQIPDTIGRIPKYLNNNKDNNYKSLQFENVKVSPKKL